MASAISSGNGLIEEAAAWKLHAAEGLAAPVEKLEK